MRPMKIYIPERINPFPPDPPLRAPGIVMPTLTAIVPIVLLVGTVVMILTIAGMRV